MLLLRHFVEEENGLYRANPREEMLLRYYANSIAHLAVRRQPRPVARPPPNRRLNDTRGHECSPTPTASKAADTLMNAEKTRKQATQLSVTFPGITFEDAYAISTEVREAPHGGGREADRPQGRADLQGDAASSQIDEPDYGYLFESMMVADGAKVPHENYCAPRVEIELAFVLGKRAQRPRRRPDRRAARDRICRARDRDRRRAPRSTRARSSTRSRTMARRPASWSAAARSARWTSTCAGSAG